MFCECDSICETENLNYLNKYTEILTKYEDLDIRTYIQVSNSTNG